MQCRQLKVVVLVVVYIKASQRTLAQERTPKRANAVLVRDLLDPHSRAQSG